MRDYWEDLIPFYVAGTLSSQEMQGFEQHLSTCQRCQEALATWTLIGNTVVDQGSRWGANPPPLRFHEIVDQPIGLFAANSLVNPTQKRSSTIGGKRRFEWALGVAAACLIAVFGVSLLLYAMLSSEPDHADQVAVIATPLGTAKTQSATSSQSTVDGGQGENDLGILPVPTAVHTALATLTQPVPIPSPSSVILPTAMSLPSPMPLPQESLNAPTPETGAMLAPVATSTLNGRTCLITSNGDAPVSIFREPNLESDVVYSLVPGQYLQLWMGGDATWRLVGWPEGGLAGWVLTREIQYAGACDTFLIPTPTLTSICTVVGVVDGVTYAGPGFGYSQLSVRVDANSTVIVLGLSDNDWARISYTSSDGVIRTGWLPLVNIVIAGTCDFEPRIPVSEYSPEPTPRIITPTGHAPASTPSPEFTTEF